MIERIQAYRASDGTTHATLEEVQKHELSEVLCLTSGAPVQDVAALIFEHRERVLDILTTSPTSKAKARKINGGTKKRVKVEGVAES